MLLYFSLIYLPRPLSFLSSIPTCCLPPSYPQMQSFAFMSYGTIYALIFLPVSPLRSLSPSLLEMHFEFPAVNTCMHIFFSYRRKHVVFDFQVWLIWLTMIISSSVHFPVNVISVFFFMAEWNTTLYTPLIVFTHSWLYRHLNSCPSWLWWVIQHKNEWLVLLWNVDLWPFE